MIEWVMVAPRMEEIEPHSLAEHINSTNLAQILQTLQQKLGPVMSSFGEPKGSRETKPNWVNDEQMRDRCVGEGMRFGERLVVTSAQITPFEPNYSGRNGSCNAAPLCTRNRRG